MHVPISLSTDLPYFSRAPLDEQSLAYLGMLKGVAMFAPRRHGKTQFVKRELIPGAQNHGYAVVYVDLWVRTEDPDLAVVEALEAKAGGRRTRGMRLAGTKLSAKLKGGVAEVGGEAEYKASSTPTADTEDLLGRLADAVARLAKKHRALLLVIDEFQSLAKTRGTGFEHALRAHIQAHAHLKFFLTGSSRRMMAQMLTRQDSPFLGMATPIDLPPLDRAFVEDRAEVYAERTGRTIDVDALDAIFQRLNRVPEYLNEMVAHMIIQGVNDPEDGYGIWRSKLLTSATGEKWSKLSDLDRLLLQAIAEDRAGLFSKGMLEWYGQQLGQEVNVGDINSARRRLITEKLVMEGVERGQLELADDAMRTYLREAGLKLPGQLPDVDD